MKYFVVSDIHGSSYYLKKALSLYEKSNAEKIIILGDILYHGPRNDLPKGYAPKEVIAILNPLSEKIIAVRGNCEAEVDQMVLDFCCMDTYKCIDTPKRKIYLTHGHHLDEIPSTANDVVLAGHTHVPKIEQCDNYLYINPGSVSIPKENSAHSCAVMDEEKIEFFDIFTEQKYDAFYF